MMRRLLVSGTTALVVGGAALSVVLLAPDDEPTPDRTVTTVSATSPEGKPGPGAPTLADLRRLLEESGPEGERFDEWLRDTERTWRPWVEQQLLQLPAELRRDLERVGALPHAEQPDALLDLRDDAVAGAYGPRVKEGVEGLQRAFGDLDHWLELWESWPQRR